MSNITPWVVVLAVVAAALLLFSRHGGYGPPSLQPAVLDVEQLSARGVEPLEGLYVTTVAKVRTGEVAWLRIEDSIPLHIHQQDEFVYVLKAGGSLKLADGSTIPVEAGQLYVIPAGVAVGVVKGDTPGEFLEFATPAETAGGTVWLEGDNAQTGIQIPQGKPEIINVAERIANGLDQEREGFQFTIVHETKTGSVELFRIEKGVVMHKHAKENHVLYVLRGRAQGTIGNSDAEVGPGQVVVIPANIPHKLQRVGDEPFDFLLFSTPPFRPDDIVWLK